MMMAMVITAMSVLKITNDDGNGNRCDDRRVHHHPSIISLYAKVLKITNDDGSCDIV